MDNGGVFVIDCYGKDCVWHHLSEWDGEGLVGFHYTEQTIIIFK